eukprot:1375880-Ditylum_brightwellii.AAC.1
MEEEEEKVEFDEFGNEEFEGGDDSAMTYTKQRQQQQDEKMEDNIHGQLQHDDLVKEEDDGG